MAPAASATVSWLNNIPAAGAPAEASLNHPDGVAMDGSNIVVADTADNELKTYTPSGTFQQAFKPELFKSPVLALPRQAALVGSDFITSSSFGAEVLKINATTGANDGAFSTAVSWSFPLGVSTNSAQSRVLVSDATNNAVYLFDSSGSLLKTLTGEGTLKGPEDAAFDSSGNIWVADTQNHRIVELSEADEVKAKWTGNDGGSEEFYPTGLVINQTSGDIWVADFHNSEVAEFDPSGNLIGSAITEAEPGSHLFWPVTVALDPTNSMGEPASSTPQTG